jgi:DNA-binding LacI/PurR family transcriptional regulator
MMTRKPTSLDVARIAGVSQSAVSRTYTPGASVSPRTRARILAAAEEIGYRPNALARSLIVGRTRIIGLIVAHLDNQFYPAALERLSLALKARGYHILVFLAGNRNRALDPALDDLIDYQVDGILMGSATISNRLAERCESAGIPVVLFNRHQQDPALSSVTSDNHAGAAAAAEHLVAGGHRRIAHIAGSQDASTGYDRARGFRDGLARHGVELEVFVDCGFRPAVARRVTRRIFGQAERPDAVFAANDQIAFTIMDTLRYELGLAVPGDVAVIGYDDVDLAAWPAYDLTTVRQDADSMVRATVKTLLDRIEGGDRTPRHVVLDSPLVVRGSTRPVPPPAQPSG